MAGRLRAVVQAGAVDKMGIFHPQFLGPLVHPGDKCLLRPGDVLRHGAGAIVGGGHGNGFEHIRHGHGLPRFQIDLAAALCRRRLGGGNLVGHGDAPAVHRFHNQQHGHDFRHTGRGQRLVGIGFIQYCAGGHVHQHGAFTRHRKLRPCRLNRRKHRQKKSQSQQSPNPLHRNPSKPFLLQLICPIRKKYDQIRINNRPNVENSRRMC